VGGECEKAGARVGKCFFIVYDTQHPLKCHINQCFIACLGALFIVDNRNKLTILYNAIEASMKPAIKFVNTDKTDFYKVLRERVDDYFTEKGITPHANAAMVVKTVIMLAMYFLPFGLIVSSVATGWLFWICWVVMGFGLAGIGMSVMHDANHKAYSADNRINTLVGYTLNLVGGDAKNWKLQHNILHHTFTNIHPADEDVADKPGMRFSPSGAHRGFHRLQFLYAFGLYSLMTLFWVLLKDFPQHFRYIRNGVSADGEKRKWRDFFVLLGWKVFYVSYTVVWPILVLDIPAWHVLLGFLILHLVAGTVLSVVFQLAHVVETSDFPQVNAQGDIETEWAIHQLRTTADFSGKNPLLTYYVGGLNYQVIHHLFPRICHIHYPAIAPIVAATAHEYGLPYIHYPTFGAAFRSHVRMLKNLGRKDYHHLVQTMG
jgi:linoleoyl-CoA desaturase